MGRHSKRSAVLQIMTAQVKAVLDDRNTDEQLYSLLDGMRGAFDVAALGLTIDADANHTAMTQPTLHPTDAGEATEIASLKHTYVIMITESLYVIGGLGLELRSWIRRTREWIATRTPPKILQSAITATMYEHSAPSPARTELAENGHEETDKEQEQKNTEEVNTSTATPADVNGTQQRNTAPTRHATRTREDIYSQVDIVTEFKDHLDQITVRTSGYNMYRRISLMMSMIAVGLLAVEVYDDDPTHTFAFLLTGVNLAFARAVSQLTHTRLQEEAAEYKDKLEGRYRHWFRQMTEPQAWTHEVARQRDADKRATSDARRSRTSDKPTFFQELGDPARGFDAPSDSPERATHRDDGNRDIRRPSM